MYKSENDRTEKFGIAETGEIPDINSNAVANVFTINTDATTGTLTISVKSRLSTAFAPLLRADNSTPVVLDLSTTERTIGIGFPLKEIKAVPAGLNGTSYDMNISGAGNFQ